MSELSTYTLVKDALETAAQLNLKVSWHNQGWSLEMPTGIIKGETALEMHHYLNGFRDGMAWKRRITGE